MERAMTMPEGPWGLPVLPDRPDPRHSSGALSNCTPPKLFDQEDFEDDDNGNDSDASDQQPKERPRKPHLQGRFSGRLETKGDEKRLADECRLLGPLLGGVGKRGEKSRMTLAKIVRGIASGDVRCFCEEREGVIQVINTCYYIRWPTPVLGGPAAKGLTAAPYPSRPLTLVYWALRLHY